MREGETPSPGSPARPALYFLVSRSQSGALGTEAWRGGAVGGGGKILQKGYLQQFCLVPAVKKCRLTPKSLARRGR
jgi:hypothetical protein